MNVQLVQEEIIEMLREHVRSPKQRISLTAEEVRLGFDPVDLRAFVDGSIKETVESMRLHYSPLQSTPRELVFMDLAPSTRHYANVDEVIDYLYNENTRDFEEFVIPQNSDNVEL